MKSDFINSLNNYSRNLEQLVVDLSVSFYDNRERVTKDIQGMALPKLAAIKNEVFMLRHFLFSAMIDYPDFSYSAKTNFLDCFQIVDSFEDNLNDAWNQTDSSVLISCLGMATVLGKIFDEQREEDDH